MRKKIALFKDVGWFDDSLYGLDSFKSPKGWTVSLGSYETDGDIATVRGEIQADLADIDSDSYSKLVAKLSGTGQSLIKVQSGGTWYTVKTLGVSSGDITENIDPGLTITKIAVSSTKGPVDVDYVGITNSSPIIEEEYIEKVRVALTSTIATSKARFTILNKNKKYNAVDKGDKVLVWIGRNDLKKVFGGKISSISREWPEKRFSAVAVDLGRAGLNKEFAEVVPAEYIGAKVTTMVSGITYSSVQAGDLTLQNFETLINPTTQSEMELILTFSKTTERQALQDLAVAAGESGSQPDFYVDPTGDLVFHASGQKDSGKTLTGGENGNVIKNKHVPASKVINRITLYTPNMFKLPTDGDKWTEIAEPNVQWTGRVNYDGVETGIVDIYADKSRFNIGGSSKYLQVGIDAGASGYAQMDFDMASARDLTKYVKLYFEYYVPSGFSETSIQIRLAEDLDVDGDSTKYYYQNITLTKGSWQSVDLDTGENASGWTASGISNWESIKYIAIRSIMSSPPLDVDLWIDGLYFAKGAKYYIIENASSIASYGAESQPFTREDLTNEDDVESLLNGLIGFYATPRNNEITVVKGDAELIPGVNIPLEISDEDLDEVFRITKATHIIDGRGFKTELSLTATATAYWTEPSIELLGRWDRLRRWSTLGVDILPIWG